MTISRLGTTTRWSDCVCHNQTAYLVEVANTLTADLSTQTREVLANVEATLARVGSDKSRLLMVTIYLDDIRQIELFNQVWDNWIPQGFAPVRACVQARLAKPEYLVEVQAIAALK